jgi:hypothetical protein
MSWKFPKYPIKETQVVDLEDMNENFYSFAEEIGGRLNEHNWQEGAISSNTQVAKDAAFVWHQDGDSPTIGTFLAHPNTGDQLITARPTWTKIEDCSVTFTSPDCLLWIHGTVQLNQVPATAINGVPSVTGNVWNDEYFQLIQFAIMIDGYVIPETIVGGTELDNDEVCGIKQPMFPTGTSLVLPVAAGQHTITLVTRAVGPTFNKSTTAAVNQESPWGFYASSRELIVLEMRR